MMEPQCGRGKSVLFHIGSDPEELEHLVQKKTELSSDSKFQEIRERQFSESVQPWVAESSQREKVHMEELGICYFCGKQAIGMDIIWQIPT